MSPATLNVGLIGANWGAVHIAAWRRVPGVNVAAICTSSQASAVAAADRYHIPKSYCDVDAMLSDPTLDIIDITPRPSIRAPLVEAALRARKHVLQPLPFALDLEQGRRLVELAQAAGVVALVESLHRHSPAFKRARELVEQGELGDIHSIRGRVRTGILLDPPANYAYSWIVDAANGASALRNFGAHLLHTLVWMFGEITAVAAHMHTRLPTIEFADGTAKRNEVVDNAALLLQFANGAAGDLEVSWTEPGADGFLIDVAGSQGRLALRADGLGPQNARLQFAARKDARLRDVRIETPQLSASASPNEPERGSQRAVELTSMCEEFAQAVRTGQAGHPNFTQAFAVMNVVESAYRAAAERRWVDTREFAGHGA
jgi:predicted dehydrogenase